MSTESTAVARIDDGDLTEAGKAEVRGLRQAGALAISKQQEINLIRRQVAGMTWGTGYQMVKGSDLSGASQHAIAQLVSLTGANLALHIHILGGRPYLNADYWAERCAGQEHFVRMEQRNLSLRHIEELRGLAETAQADGDEDEAKNLRRESRELQRMRSHYSPPDWAQEVYETIIYRYRESAPLHLIRLGQIDAEPWIEEVRECNWAGGKPRGRTKDGKDFEADPVGNAEPSKTARSRSARRCGVRAFQATLAPIEQELRKLEDAIEAEFVEIATVREEERAALPTATGEQAVRIGAGEPEAAAPQDAKPLPVQEAPRKALTGHARQEKAKYEAGCKALGVADLALFEQDILGRPALSLEDYVTLNAKLAQLADGDGTAEQGGLGV